MYIDSTEVVRVRVEVDEFVDDEPGPPKATEGVRHEREAGRAPYSIIVSHFKHSTSSRGLIMRAQCSIAEQGLGPVSWWKAGEEEVMDEG